MRRYAINRGMLDDFDGAWIIPERNEFIWMMRYNGDLEEFRARDAAYYASGERAMLRPNPAQWIARAEHWFVTSVLSNAY